MAKIVDAETDETLYEGSWEQIFAFMAGVRSEHADDCECSFCL